ncbi:MAG: response regulator [Candidatus Omnitrophica bacterium]|nr:response regulator [Candidatus Omnitrophota bacterium]
MTLNNTILVVDDEPDVLELLELDLSSRGFAVIKADCGEDAIKKAKAYLPDIILMDVLMPDMNGGQAVRLLQADPHTQNIPTLFLTAAMTREDKNWGITVDQSFYPALAKPFEISELLTAIDTLLSRTKKVGS